MDGEEIMEKQIRGLTYWLAAIFVVVATITIAMGPPMELPLPADDAGPYYAKPSRYELDNGPPDEVCKWWGGGYGERPKMTECYKLMSGGGDE